MPLVELSCTNALTHFTDSAGLIAFAEQGMMDRPVFFKVKSHGYEFQQKVMNLTGVILETITGGKATLKIKRINIAERLYRITGEGIYNDSVLLGLKTPIAQPLVNGLVAGLDSVFATPYRGKIYWFWGDTVRTGAPHGHFRTAGATSELPGRGGLGAPRSGSGPDLLCGSGRIQPADVPAAREQGRIGLGRPPHHAARPQNSRKYPRNPRKYPRNPRK